MKYLSNPRKILGFTIGALTFGVILGLIPNPITPLFTWMATSTAERKFVKQLDAELPIQSDVAVADAVGRDNGTVYINWTYSGERYDSFVDSLMYSSTKSYCIHPTYKNLRKWNVPLVLRLSSSDKSVVDESFEISTARCDSLPLEASQIIARHVSTPLTIRENVLLSSVEALESGLVYNFEFNFPDKKEELVVAAGKMRDNFMAQYCTHDAYQDVRMLSVDLLLVFSGPGTENVDISPISNVDCATPD